MIIVIIYLRIFLDQFRLVKTKWVLLDSLLNIFIGLNTLYIFNYTMM